MESKTKRQLSRQITIIAGIALTATVLLNAVVAALTGRTQLIAARSEQLGASAMALSLQIDAAVADARRAATAWRDFDFAQRLAFESTGPAAVAAANRELAGLLSIYRQFNSAHIIGPSGMVIASADPSQAGILDLGDREYVKRAFGGETTVSDIFLNRATGEPYFAIAVPFTDDVSAVRAVLMITNSIRDFSARVVETIKVGETGYAYLTNRAGVVIAHPNPQYVWQLDLNETTYGRSMIESSSGVTEYRFDRVRRLAAFRRNENTGWIGVVSVEYSEILGAVTSLFIRTILTGLLSAAAAVVLLWFFIVRALAGIGSVGARMHQIADGAADLTVAIDYRGTDEIGDLVVSFNRFIEGQRALIANVQRGSTDALDKQLAMESTTEETASAATEIAATTESVSRNMRTLRDHITSAEERVELLAKGTETLDVQVQQQSGAVEQSTASVEQMLASLRSVAQVVTEKRNAANRLYQNAGENETALTNAGHQISEVVELVGKIGRITKVIGQITAQTNMLAMNAAIEAAHAGESGRGFAVVADEIRKLAEGSAKNSREIGMILREIVGKIEQTGNTTAGAVSAFNELYTEIRAVADAFEELSGTIHELSGGSDEILRAMHDLRDSSATVLDTELEMKRAVRQVGEALAAATEIAGQTTNAMDEINSGTGEISTAMIHVRDLVAAVAESNAALAELVRAYKTH